MIEIVWEFVVKEGFQGQFELAYGPGGAWSKLFAQSPGFRGTTLLRDTQNSLRYLAIDIWDSATQREQALVEIETDYSAVDAGFRDWTESRTQLGVFRVQAEATVRPLGKASRSKARDARQRRRRTTL